MDFDHLGDKTINVSTLVKYASMAKVRLEISKCDLVCVLCHRTRTYQRACGQTPDTPFGRYYLKKREFVWNFKKKPCESCGVQYEPWQMDLDHKDPSLKNHTKATRGAGVLSMSLTRIREELPGLAVLCAACHRVKTFQEI